MPDVIYLDAAASTPPFAEVVQQYVSVGSVVYANPASGHGLGKAAHLMLEQARAEVLELLGAERYRLVFTSGATEGNNWILQCVPAGPGARVVISAVEHASVRRAAQAAAGRFGWSLEILPVGKDGTLDPAVLDDLVARPPDVLSIMAVNNETGIIFPVSEIGRRLREAGAKTFFHVDAVHAVARGFWPTSLDGISALSLSAHKFHGLKGGGMLLVDRGASLSPLLYGGEQEDGLRSGTVHVASAVASATALRLCLERRDEAFFDLGRRLRDGIAARLPQVTVVGEGAPGVPWICMVAVPGMRGDALVRMMDAAGIEISSGSACASGKQGLSATLAAMMADFRKGYIRFSYHLMTSPAEIDEAVGRFANIIERYSLSSR
ncbi:cysteine desulfurase [Myxococcota bacterium]|nr:cysteine desulfurase [Myxococcota bacterium]MBU1511590.1 cysteine desulfurase [Myxococcota bacterium]